MQKSLRNIYKMLYAHFGPRHWWPAESPFEVMVGAILTQNTAWPNVEKAITNLKRKRLLSPRKIDRATSKSLYDPLRPSGYYKEKSKKLKAFVKFLIQFSKGNIDKLRTYGTKSLRKELLKIKGVGPETADSMLLYALNKPVFVVDAYTKRILTRHKLIPRDATYEKIQDFFMNSLPRRAKLFNEYHALIVEAGKNYCKKRKPLCKICPLSAIGGKTVDFNKDMV